MVVKYRCNIDAYKGHLPGSYSSSIIPRKGELVNLRPYHKDKNEQDYFDYNRIPSILEVTRVEYYTDGVVIVELWFNETDHKLYNGQYILEHGHNRDKVPFDYNRK